MGFGWTPGWTLLLVIPSTLLVIVTIHAVRRCTMSKATIHERDIEQSHMPVSSFKLDSSLRRSLYADSTLDITNPRDSTQSLTLYNTKYATPPVTRPQSLYAMSTRMAGSTGDLADAKYAQMHYEEIVTHEERRRSRSASRPSMRHESPLSRDCTRPNDYDWRDGARSRPTSISPIEQPLAAWIPHSRPSSMCHSRSRNPSQSPRRPSYSRKSTDLASVHSRRSSISAADLRHSLYSNDSPALVRPEVPGVSPFPPGRSRDSSVSRLPSMTSQRDQSSYANDFRKPQRHSMLDMSLNPSTVDPTDLRELPIGADYPSTPDVKRGRHATWDPDAPPVPPLPMYWMVTQSLRGYD